MKFLKDKIVLSQINQTPKNNNAKQDSSSMKFVNRVDEPMQYTTPREIQEEVKFAIKYPPLKLET